MKNSKLKIIVAVALISFGVLGRLLLQDLPNVETLTVVSLLAGSLLGGGYFIMVPLAAVAISDIFIGNDPIMLFTWSAWALVGVLGFLLRKSKKDYKLALKLTGMGAAASVLFFIWTNFGVWAMWNMYPHTLTGLIQCYTMAIPFLKMNLLGNMIIVPAVSLAAIFAIKKYSILSKARNEELAIEKINN